MKKMMFFALCSASLLIACQSTEDENTTSTQNTTTNTPATVSGTDTQNTEAAPTATTIPPAASVVAAPVTAPPPPPATIAGASPKVNPAHGLPGHRCELAVGAPLPDVGPAPATQAQVVPAALAGQAGPTVQSIAIPPPPANSGSPISGGSKKVNPAHGQPGHRCDIAVGAPLN
jgi:hypothetical protein